jgi:hypothetical protein
MQDASQKLQFAVRLENTTLAVDLEALSLLQATLLTEPNQTLIMKLKSYYGIQLTPSEILLELKSINSPLRKYLLSMTMSLIRRAKMLMDETFLYFLLKEQKNKIKRIRRLFMLLQKRRARSRRLLAMMRPKLKIMNSVVSNNLSCISCTDIDYSYRYILEAHRYGILCNGLQTANIKSLPIICKVVDSHVNILKDSFKKYLEIKQNQNDEIEDQINNWLMAAIQRMEGILAAVKNLKQTESESEHLDDIRNLLLAVLSNDLLTFKQLINVDHSISGLSEQPTDSPSSESIDFVDTKSNQCIYSKDRLWLEVLFNNINNFLTNHLIDKNKIILYEFENIELLLNLLKKIVHKKGDNTMHREALFDRINLIISNFEKCGDNDYESFVQCLRRIYSDTINSTESVTFNKFTSFNPVLH